MRVALTALLVFVSQAAQAQDVPPALLVRSGQAVQPLRLKQAETAVKLAGGLAETQTTLTYCNPGDRQLEGTLHFPLPEGSTVSGYALDVAGVLVDGVAIEKEKGQVVFEKEVRKGVDPGLVEWTKGNNFKTRVYPIPPKGCRTVAVRYVSRLSRTSEGQAYSLPLSYSEALDAFTLRLSVSGGPKPKIRWPGPGGLQLTEKGQEWAAATTLRGAKLTGELAVIVGSAEAAQALTAVEVTPSDDAYFAVSDSLPQAPPPSDKAPSRVTILWDTSASRQKSAHEAELSLLDAYFARFARSEVSVELITFANAALAPRRFTVKDGKSAALRAELEKLSYDGGTQMSAIAPGAKSTVPDVYLLFSDGLSSFGAPEAKGFRAPLFAFSSDLVYDAVALTALAEASGGSFQHLSRKEPGAVAQTIGGARLAIMSVSATDGAVDDVFPKPGKPLSQELMLVGKLRGNSATLLVELGVAGKVTERRQYKLARGSEQRGDLLARAWAQEKVLALAAFPERNHQALLSLGKAYGLVTPATSLIVLERLEQYVEHEIRPPKGLAAMRADYDRLMQERAAAAIKEREAKIDHIVALWEQRVEWWGTRFEYPPGFRYREKGKKKMGGGAEDLDGGGEPRAPPPPPPSQPAGSAPEAERAEPKPEEAKEEAKKDAADDGKVAEKADKDTGPSKQSAAATIELSAWTPDTPYLKALKAAKSAERERVYLEQRKEFGTSPAFFLDCADFFAAEKDAERSLRILSNVAELEIDNAALLRVLAHRLRQLGQHDLAVLVFEEVLRLRPEEPQSYRDLGLVLADLGQYERAIDLLYHVVMNRWDRFDEIEVIALMELNRILPKAKAKGTKLPAIDARLTKALDLDVRISLSWDTDLTDIDLWVEEPSGERADYSHNLTTIGGLVSHDFTQGYGPEEYVLRRAMPGTYVVKANFFGSSAQSLTGAVTLQLELFTNYGRANEKRQAITIRLTESKETFTVGKLKF